MGSYSSVALCRAVIVFVCLFALSNGLEDCVQGKNCHLPDCFCSTFKHPMGAKKIPQIVYFGFDDAVTPEVSEYYQHLFTEDRVNPNECPITMSLFVCNRYTIYSLVNEFFRESDEIGVHSVTHTYINTADKLKKEATMQKDNIIYEANVPRNDIVGWRSPNLITAGDDQPRILKELNYTYDISLPYESDENVAFPYTLDYGYPFDFCSVRPCPSKESSHPGFWEVPINTQFDPVTKIPCTYVDSCRPDSEEAAYQFLLYNFYRTYHNERAPYGLNMHAAWFYFPKYMEATERFIQFILNSYDDVYIISVSQMMAWMKEPQTIEQAKTFQPWSCDPWKAKKAAAAKANSATKGQMPPMPVESKPESTQKKDLSKFVDQRISLNSKQNWFINHKVTQPKPEVNKKPRRAPLLNSILMRKMYSHRHRK